MPKQNAAVALIFVFALIFGLNLLYPFMSDDYVFRFVWKGEHGSMYASAPDYPQVRIEGAKDIAESLWSKYFTWGGRMLTWGLAYTFANLPDIVFDVANSIMFVILVTLITMLGTQKFTFAELSPRWLWLTVILLWGASAMFTDAYLWMAGSVGYLWPMTAEIGLLFYYAREFWQGADEIAPLSLGTAFGLGILAGWSNENAGAVTVLLAAVLTFKFWRTGKLARWQIAGLIGAVLGYALLILAPGNMARAAVASAINFPELMADAPRQWGMILFALFWCLPLLMLFRRLKNLTSQAKFFAGIFFLGGILNFAMMVPLIHFPLRSLTGSVIFWLIGALTVLKNDSAIWREKIWRHIGASYVGISVITLAAYIYVMGFYLMPQDLAKDELASHSAGQNLVVEPYRGPLWLLNIAGLKGYRVDIGTIGDNPDAWQNRVYAAYWHLKSVVRNEMLAPE